MEPWYKVVTPRKEVREGRSFNPDEFAIALEQVVAGKAPEDYNDPVKFFSRTYFTQALSEHTGMVLRRLAGETSNTAPVLTLITQFGGGKTHTLASLYHLVNYGKDYRELTGVAALLDSAGLKTVPRVKTGVFVGNAWDPQDGRETPWIDLARQLAGDAGVAALGKDAMEVPPGTKALGRVFELAGGCVLILFDEVLNFINRHRKMAEPFHAFIQNLTVAMTGTPTGAMLVSLPRSQVEMTDWDMQWQDKITKVVKRVAKDLIATDEAEISEVVRRRLFKDLGDEKERKRVAKAYADWCFERRAQLPAEWTAVDTATTERKAREYLQGRFESCYPFHPSTLSVFQRKWQPLPHYQQTRGTLAMLAQWIAWAFRDGFTHARREPLITIGSAPLEVREFHSVVLGQLGETRLGSAINTDIAGPQAHSRALDADMKGPLRDIHRRVGTTILFESSGGQIDKVAHLPEIRFALGEPNLDTTSIDNAALALESKSFFLRKTGTDGFQIRHQATLKKVMSDRKASLDYETDVKPTMEYLTRVEFERGRSIHILYYPNQSEDIPDTPKLGLIVMSPESEWGDDASLKAQIAEWTHFRGKTQRMYPAALVWCLKKPGRDFRTKVENLLAWRRVRKEIDEGTLGGEFDRGDRVEMMTTVKDAEDAAKDEVWAGYRFVVAADNKEKDGLRVIDLGAGHTSGPETLCGRVVAALKSESLLNENVGAGYIERNWPPALTTSGAWPLTSLRQSFLNGSLTRLLDPDQVLKSRTVEFVEKGDFGLASGYQSDGTYLRVWFKETIGHEEVTFDKDVYLLKKEKARELKVGGATRPTTPVEPEITLPRPEAEPEKPGDSGGVVVSPPKLSARTVRILGTIPPESWNRLGTKVIPKLKSGNGLKIAIDLSSTMNPEIAENTRSDLQQIVDDLGLTEYLEVESTEG